MKKYLHQYAEPGTAVVEGIPACEPWGRVVVIPVCNESTSILRPLPPASGRSLVILVVNETEVAPPHVSVANQAFASEVLARFNLKWKSAAEAGLSLFEDPDSQRDVLLVDRFSEELRFSRKGGVGHARKTGADLAAFLIDQQRIRSPWIHCSDADVVLPQSYFQASDSIGSEAAKKTAGLIYPFHHDVAAAGVSEKVAQVTQLYEYALRYYVAGLDYASSPYAFHTIGSTLAVNAHHYGKVRGFPRRQAGEDFYLLNKLAKVGDIRQLVENVKCGPINIAARTSDRVPFGTGAAVSRMVELEDPFHDYLFYHPSLFDWLRGWLESLPEFWQKQSSDVAAVLTERELDCLISPLKEAGAQQALEHALRQSSDLDQYLRQMHTWFDAFRTLKFIHYLRDHFTPSIPFAVLVKEQNIGHFLEHEPVLPSLHTDLHTSLGRQIHLIKGVEDCE